MFKNRLPKDLTQKRYEMIASMWDNFKTGEIAKKLGMPESTVSTIAHRLRKHGVPLARKQMAHKGINYARIKKVYLNRKGRTNAIVSANSEPKVSEFEYLFGNTVPVPDARIAAGSQEG
jgi:biotin operon repressor